MDTCAVADIQADVIDITVVVVVMTQYITYLNIVRRYG